MTLNTYTPENLLNNADLATWGSSCGRRSTRNWTVYVGNFQVVHLHRLEVSNSLPPDASRVVNHLQLRAAEPQRHGAQRELSRRHSS